VAAGFWVQAGRAGAEQSVTGPPGQDGGYWCRIRVVPRAAARSL